MTWRSGGTVERLFVILLVLDVGAGMVGGFILVAYGRFFGVPPLAPLSIVVQYACIGFYQQAFLRPMYSPEAYRIAAREGFGPSGGQQYLELARYLDEHGVRGHLPGEVARGLLAWILFDACLIGGLLAAIQLSDFTGVLPLVPGSVVVVILSALAWRSYAKWVDRNYTEAVRKGFKVRAEKAEGERGQAFHERT